LFLSGFSSRLVYRSNVRGLLLCRERLDVEGDIDLVADDHATGFEWGVEANSEVTTDDARRRAIGDAVVAPRIGRVTADAGGKGHALRRAADRQIALDRECWAAAGDRGASERELWIVRDVEKVGRAQVRIARFVARADARCIDHRLNRRRDVAGAERDRSEQAGEVASHLGDHQVADGEQYLGVGRVDCIRSGRYGGLHGVNSLYSCRGFVVEIKVVRWRRSPEIKGGDVAVRGKRVGNCIATRSADIGTIMLRNKL
jgi:hypothetical protein